MFNTRLIPEPELINRINILQHTASYLGVSLALSEDYTPKDVQNASVELSYMIKESLEA